MSPFEDDFIGKIKPLDSTLTGLSDAAIVEGIGWIEWHVRDYCGKVGRIKTQIHYVPKATIRLMSPQHCFRDYRQHKRFKNGRCTFDLDWLTLTAVTPPVTRAIQHDD